MSATSTLRTVAKVIQGMKASDGAGVRLTRSIGSPMVRNLDPFLMLDEIKSPSNEAMAGFPSHPHRGFETCTIMIQGKMEHKDSVGNKGLIEDGGVQYMSAGRGIIHSEMPIKTDGLLWGFQLWINLPAKDKMSKPRYQDYQAKDIPSVNEENLIVRVLAGTYKDTTGPIKMRGTPALIMDVQVKAGGKFSFSYPEIYNGFVYISDGEGNVNGKDVKHENAVVFEQKGDLIEASSDKGMRFLLIAGKPIGEPIVQHGPFVMNTRDEIFQAFMDYEQGRFQRKEDNPWIDD